MPIRAGWAGLVLLALGPGVLAAQDRAAVDRELAQVYGRFSEAYRRADADMVAGLYTEDAYYLQPGGDVIRGRAALRESFARFLGPIAARREPGPAIYFDILERVIDGGHGWDVGYFRMGPAGSDSASTPRGGKFIVLWRKDPDGAWRIHGDGYSGLGGN